MIGVAVRQLPKLAKDFVDFGQIVGVLVLDVSVAECVIPRQVGIVVQVWIFKKPRDSIHPKT